MRFSILADISPKPIPATNIIIGATTAICLSMKELRYMGGIKTIIIIERTNNNS